MARLLAKDYRIVEIDVDRMKYGKAVETRLTKGESKGYPWSLILDAGGETLVTSDSPEGNIGCPVTEEEAAWLFEMLGRTRQRLTDEDLEVLRAEHTAFAKPILDRMNRR